MILEQSFHALPEFLVGAGFDRYDSEGTLVMAYAMAVLQELNGRNVNNPIAQVSGERSYPGLPRRTADLRLKYDQIGVLSPDLLAYGIRPDNWLEAKFFRKNLQSRQPTMEGTPAAYVVLRDLLRLCCFPGPNEGRYFLHAYEGVPEDHLAFERNPAPRVPRGWLTNLHKPGHQSLSGGDLTLEPAQFDLDVGPALRGVDLTAEITTFELREPTAKYALYLSRIDQCHVTLNNNSITLARDGTVSDVPVGAGAGALRTAVAAGLVK